MPKRERQKLSPAELADMVLESEDLPPEVMARVNKATTEADAEDLELRVNFRWDRQSLELVREAAKVMGNIPYQTYLKQAVIRQARLDLAQAQMQMTTYTAEPSIAPGMVAEDSNRRLERFIEETRKDRKKK